MAAKVTSRKKKYKSLEGSRDSVLGDAETTIFSSRDSMTSAERDAVKKGENRGKVAVMNENPEKYGNIASINQRKYIKNSALIFGNCKKCKAFVPGTDKPGEHCSLSESENCLE